MNRKKDKRPDFYKECCDYYYLKNSNSINEKNDYMELDELYSEIKKDYYNKLKRKEIKISVEKIRLESQMGKYISKLGDFSLNYYIAMVAVFMTLYLEKLNVFGGIIFKNIDKSVASILNSLAALAIFMLLIQFFVCIMDKDIEKDKRESLINNIKLKVLEDIEKEIH